MARLGFKIFSAERAVARASRRGDPRTIGRSQAEADAGARDPRATGRSQAEADAGARDPRATGRSQAEADAGARDPRATGRSQAEADAGARDPRTISLNRHVDRQLPRVRATPEPVNVAF
jgi:hypothetical protein